VGIEKLALQPEGAFSKRWVWGWATHVMGSDPPG
jgi:hypothetical protein